MNMWTARKVLAIAVGVGTGLWVFDAVVDAVFFYPDRPFPALLVTAIPPHELYVRSLLLVLIVGFGAVIGWGLERIHKRDRDARLFRQVVDAATDSVFVIDPETGRFVDVNESACEALGYDRSTLLGMTVADINPRFETPSEFLTFLTSPEGEELEYYETTHVGADDEPFPVEISASTVVVEGHEYRVAIARDISDRKARERRIAHYKQAVESSRDQLAAIDATRSVLFANEAYRSFHGIEADSLHGRPLEDVLAPTTFETIEPQLERALSGEQVHFEMTRTHDEGTHILDIRYWPLRDADGEVHGVGASLRDVTDRTAMIEDLRRSRERYESLFESIRDAILVVDTDRTIRNCNQAFTDLFGYRLEEVEGKSTAAIYAHDDDFEVMGKSLGQHAEDPTFVETIDYEKKSGQVFPGETNVFYLRDRNGAVTGYIGLIRDVSDRRARITQIRTIDRVLRHNLNNALTVILGNAETIIDGNEDPRWSAQRIIRAGEHLQTTARKERVITSFLAEPRPSVERDVVALIEGIIAELREQYPDADLTADLPETQPVLAVEYLDRAIRELIENAIEHADRPDPSATVTIETAGDVVEINVADNGPGIPEMEQQVLAGDHDIEPLFHGRGLGLWLVYLVVQHSDGHLSFAESDYGSIVTIRLQTPQ